MAKLPFRYALDANDDPVSGAGLYLFDAGTTNAVTMYTDSGLTTPHSTPVVANAAGVFADIYVADGDYKIDIRDTLGSSLSGYPEDNVEVSAIGTMASQSAASVAITGGSITGITDLAIADGGTGASTAAAAFANLSVAPTITVLTTGTAATYTTPTNCKALLVEMVGGGGGGGGADGGAGSGTCALATAGGGGGYCRKLITTPAASYTYTVGAGGAGGASGNNSGSAGTASTFTDGASLSLSAGGGSAGSGDISTTASAGTSGTTGGTSSGGDVNISGGPVPAARIISGDPTAPCLGGASVFGTGAVGGVNAAGADASIPGTGGGGAGTWDNASNFAGGDGADGIIIITEFY